MREWVITNGIGGYASSTDKGGMNTRRYHGLLIASLEPPAQRTLILSKVDESIEMVGEKYPLYTNEVGRTVSEGYKYQKSFEKSIVPVYTYKVKNVEIQKTICMMYGKNAVAIIYKISNSRAKLRLNLTPLVNFRDFHAEKHDKEFNYEQRIENDKIQIDFLNGYKVNIGVKGAKYEPHRDDIFYNMHYSREEDRGFDDTENHYIPGTFIVDVKPNEDKEVVFVCGLEGVKYGISLEDTVKVNGDKLLKQEVSRIEKQIDNSKLLDRARLLHGEDKEAYEELVKTLIVASDNFIVKRDRNLMYTILAGYPWFLDWGRDAFISFEGLLLIPKRFDIAKDVLLTFAERVNQGLIPNGFSEYTDTPLYNSVDSSLLLIDSTYKYLKYTDDEEFVKEKLYDILVTIIENYIDGINIDDNNIYVEDRTHLLCAGTENTQNTWMDAKVDGKPVTPRNGKAVEINAMWYNALRCMESMSLRFKKVLRRAEYKFIADKIEKTFVKEFYDENKRALKDTTEDNRIRPNQLFALSMEFPVLDLKEDIAKEVFITTTQKLLTKYGLKTLALGEEGYEPIYQGTPSARDRRYHQGCTWVWLLSPYYHAMKNLIEANKDENELTELNQVLVNFKEKVAEVFAKELMEGNTIGSISELYDSVLPTHGKGAFAQAWSVAAIMEILLDS